VSLVLHVRHDSTQIRKTFRNTEAIWTFRKHIVLQQREKKNVKVQVMKVKLGSCHKRQKPQAPTPQAQIRNRQRRKLANTKGLNRNTNLT